MAGGGVVLVTPLDTLDTRTGIKRAASRAFNRALALCDVTFAVAAEVLDVSPSCVSHKAAPEHAAPVGVHDLVRLLRDERTREAAVEYLRWIGDHGDCDVVPRAKLGDLHSIVIGVANLDERASQLSSHVLRSGADGYVDVDEATTGRARAIHLVELGQVFRDFFDGVLRERGRRVSLVREGR